MDQEYRREHRKEIGSVLLPFLSTRQDNHECFEYLIIDISSNGLKISIPKWLVGKDRLEKDDLINLHIPFRLQDETYNQGKVAWIKWDDKTQGQVCGIHIEHRMPFYETIYISLETSQIVVTLKDFNSIEDALLKILKDMGLLKKGVLIYLNHIIPYFSRITRYSSGDYRNLKNIYLDDIIGRVENNYHVLEKLYQQAQQLQGSKKQLPEYIDLEELRENVESEINLDILKTTFSNDSIMPYLDAIKVLEKKQYLNYNTLVMLYLQSL
ncbi:MAG: PilZ domain-containing protein [Desulfobacterales bacterium]|nr:PilZ domain-containing protein [Desulfobacterales bacterium]